MEKQITVELPEGDSLRVDRYISRLGILKRSQFEASGLQITQGGKPLKLSKKVTNGDIINLYWEEPEEPRYEAEEMDLDILFENENVIVLNKPQGVVVHPGNGNYHGTLVQGLLFYNRTLSDEFSTEKVRPGIVHRLDKDTSGLIITAKNYETLEDLSSQFRDRSTEKYYIALVKGRMPSRRGDIEGYIKRDDRNRKKFTVHDSQGKYALTRYEVLKAWENYTLVKLKLETGRTHQLRVHLLSVGCPILGDPVYSRKDNRYPQMPLMLHSWILRITLPGEEEPREFTAPVPERFQQMEDLLNRDEQK